MWVLAALDVCTMHVHSECHPCGMLDMLCVGRAHIMYLQMLLTPWHPGCSPLTETLATWLLQNNTSRPLIPAKDKLLKGRSGYWKSVFHCFGDALRWSVLKISNVSSWPLVCFTTCASWIRMMDMTYLMKTITMMPIRDSHSQQMLWYQLMMVYKQGWSGFCWPTDCMLDHEIKNIVRTVKPGNRTPPRSTKPVNSSTAFITWFVFIRLSVNSKGFVLDYVRILCFRSRKPYS